MWIIFLTSASRNKARKEKSMALKLLLDKNCEKVEETQTSDMIVSEFVVFLSMCVCTCVVAQELHDIR